MDNILLYFQCAPCKKIWTLSFASNMMIQDGIHQAYKLVQHELKEEYVFSEQLLILKRNGWSILNPNSSFLQSGLCDGDTLILF
ncbi:MAG: hypothetical protein ACK5LZ_03895 [Anaerorhabdus sp.]